ncbi:S49 family peptidase [Aureimonas glaciei]|uniref:Serine peptidase n=1 Tax=Aureimonas glaciei TaxID=1776957 RepID=A0A917DAD7_9HYPH|nr:S49 family peptidase [Aureimonas glaciei]GGD19741.1 serine peptidase [Aureimonas glaciei]
MPIDLPHIASRVFGTPLLLHRGKLDTILSAIGPRLLNGLEVEKTAEVESLRNERRERSAFVGARRSFAAGGYLADDGIAVLPIYGTLIRRGSWLDSASGMTSYGALTEGVTDIMSSPEVRGMMLEMDTPGGEAGGVFDLADFIRTASEATGKPVWAHANELAASAGYAIASAASRIWVPTTGEVGSIGVVGAHIDQSAYDAKLGVKWTYIFSGDHKVDGNSHEPLTDRAATEIQRDVEDLYGMFVDLVARNRGITVEKIRATNADIYRGRRAVDSGLADDVGTFDDAMEAFAASIDELQSSTGVNASSSTVRRSLMAGRSATAPKPGATEAQTDDEFDKNTPKGGKAEKDEGKDDEADEGKVEPVKEKAAEPDAAAVASAAERRRCADLNAIGVQASRMGVKFDVGAAIEKGTSPDAARSAVMKAASEKDAAETTTHVAPAGKSGGGSSAEGTASAWKKAMKRR